MKKRYWMIGALLSVLLFSGCGQKEGNAETEPIEKTEESLEQEEPDVENWGSAPEYVSSMITNSSIRYLSVTVGATKEEANLTWFSPDSAPGSVFWTSPEDTEFAEAKIFEASAMPSKTIDGYYVNRAVVTELVPDTDYLYQVGTEGAFSPAYAYHAARTSEDFRFTAVGDAQLGKPVEELDRQKNIWHKVLNKVKHHFPDTEFLVSLGDQVNDYDDTEEYSAYLNQGVLYSLPLAPVKGNHDMGGPQFSEHFALPNPSGYGTCDDEGDGDYWFVRGNALFLVLDVMDFSRMEDHKEFIAEAVEANPDCAWRIVFSHYSAYNGYEKYLENSENIRPFYLEFCDTYDIDLVMTGHDHAYIRTHFIQADGSYVEQESPAADPEGTLFVTLGSSSGSLYHTPTQQEEFAEMRKGKFPEVTDVQVTENALTLTTYNAETWEVMDTYTIQKTPFTH